MTEFTENNLIKKEIIIIFDGELLRAEENSIEYKALFDVVESTATSVTRFANFMDQSGDVSFFARPPREKCFEMVLQATQFAGNVAIPLLPYANSINEAVANFIEFVKIKKAMKGEKLTKDNVQTNQAGDVVIKNNKGDVVYTDNSRTTNVNIIVAAAGDTALNKKLEKIGKALKTSEHADFLSIGDGTDDAAVINKDEAQYLDYTEDIQERPDSVVGYVRKIDNKLFKGTLTVIEDEKERAVDFELGVPNDPGKIESLVTNLALAEAYKYRVRFIGERVMSNEKIKKIIVNDIEMLDKRFEI